MRRFMSSVMRVPTRALLVVAAVLASSLAILAAAPGAQATTIEGPCSQRSVFVPASLSVTNRTSVRIDLYWVDANCNLVGMGSVSGGRSASIRTWVGHRFVAFNSSTGVRVSDKTVRSLFDSWTVNASTNRAPTVSITAPVNGANLAVGTNVTINATAADTDGSITKVEFLRNGTVIATDTTAPYTASTTLTAAGSIRLNARATDNLAARTTSQDIIVVAIGGTNQPPTVALTSPLNGVNVAVGATINLAATAADPDGSIARVEFLRNGAVIATEFVAPYTASITPTAAGSIRLNARAIDNRGAVVTSQDVIVVVTTTTPPNAAPIVAITAPANNSTVAVGASFRVTATATDPDGSIARVEFLRNGTLFATEFIAPYDFSTSLSPAGSYTITARAIDNRGAATTSQPVTVNAGVTPPPNNPPTVAITAPANNTSVAVGTTVTINATATDPDGSVARVEFLRNGTVITTDTTSPYSTTTTLTAAGTITLTARAVDNLGAATTSQPVTVTATAVPPPPPPGNATILVLYDTTSEFAGAGQTTAAVMATMAGRFGTVTTRPVASYAAGDIGRFDQTVYIGTTFDEPLPAAFVAEAANPTRPVLWANYNIWQVATATPDFATRFGWVPTFFGSDSVAAVRYKGVDLPRETASGGLMGMTISNATLATVVAQGVTGTGTLPWAVRSGNLTYITENPFAFVADADRSLVLADLLFDTLAPTTATQTRALVRLEDVDATADPANLRAFADYLSSRNIPFSVGVIPEYRDPVLSPGSAPIRLRDRPLVVDALLYMQSKGGTLLMHGYTHQYGNVANPFNGRTGTDYEFTAMTTVAGNPVVVGPVAEDSIPWALGRLDAGIAEFVASGLGRPGIFEFPHYVASINSYIAASQRFDTRYERVTYFPGVLGGAANYGAPQGAGMPYVGRDIWGSKVIPENLGYVITGVTTPASIVANADRMKVVRDSVASFFYHPYLPLSGLQAIVEPLQAAGWTFVAPTSL